MRHASVAFLGLLVNLTAQAPPTYYNTVDASSAASLRTTLHAVIRGHTKIPYTASSTDTWNVLELADQNPANASQILDLYKNATYTKVGGGNSFYNREHSWPNSFGFPVDGTNNYPYTDCHHLFLCDIAYNSARDNKIYDHATAAWTEWVTTVNGGQGGGSGTFPGNSNWTNSAGWQTWNGRKGDVARALLYMDVRYEGGTHPVTGVAEPDLRLTDNLTLIDNSATGANLSVAYMGKLSVLLQWHDEDPPDQKEMTRNNTIHAAQGNRNPFIDHPEWVDCLFASQCVRVRQPELWINELHYDNVGTDVDELVEVAGRAGENLGGWLLVGYDGTTGAVYSYVRLSGTIPNQQNGYGTLGFPFAGLQNGPADGIALVTPDGVLMQFLSYEGSFVAVGGAANGKTATDIGVSETTSSVVGTSLQLVGTGHDYASFTWQAGLAASAGQKNGGQTFQ